MGLSGVQRCLFDAAIKSAARERREEKRERRRGGRHTCEREIREREKRGLVLRVSAKEHWSIANWRGEEFDLVSATTSGLTLSLSFGLD